MVTREQRDEIMQRETKLNAWIDTIRDPKTGWASYKPEEKPADIPNVSNDERSAVEVFDFCDNPPEKYFVYVDEKKMIVTTWTGEKLGDITQLSASTKRPSITFKGINGRIYKGRCNLETGNYALVKLAN